MFYRQFVWSIFMKNNDLAHMCQTAMQRYLTSSNLAACFMSVTIHQTEIEKSNCVSKNVWAEGAAIYFSVLVK